jgi:hypothetical protein
MKGSGWQLDARVSEQSKVGTDGLWGAGWGLPVLPGLQQPLNRPWCSGLKGFSRAVEKRLGSPAQQWECLSLLECSLGNGRKRHLFRDCFSRDLVSKHFTLCCKEGLALFKYSMVSVSSEQCGADSHKGPELPPHRKLTLVARAWAVRDTGVQRQPQK